MLVRVSENQKLKNGLKSFISKNKDYLSFSYVHLVRVSVHSGWCFCTFTCDSVHLPSWFCTFGYWFCTLAFYVHLVKVIVHLALWLVQLVRVLVQLVLFSVHLPLLSVQLEVKV